MADQPPCVRCKGACFLEGRRCEACGGSGLGPVPSAEPVSTTRRTAEGEFPGQPAEHGPGPAQEAFDPHEGPRGK